jgi:Fe-S-cluster containining protein
MKDKKGIDKGYLKPGRLSFPGEEAIYSWLPLLLDAYHLVDKGIAEAVRMEKRKQNRLACSKGCSNCCRTHKTIPVYPLELVGISWYVTEKISGTVREAIKNHLKHYKENDPCPFLVDNSCSVHPLRPISCRQFIVFGKSCDEGEDPYYTRRKDVLSPIKKYVDRAFFIMLPFYGVEKESERLKIIEKGAMHNMVKLIQTCNWKSLAERMDEFDAKNIEPQKR